jgi:lipopolysaccharide transport system ATP-binding protein
VGTAIKTQKLSKKYLIGHKRQEPYITLREAVSSKLRDFTRRLNHPFLASSGQPLTGISNTEDLWALKDVSIEVKQGERLGIIGRNGAGKSTLLKVISRITDPTEGRVSIRGRVGSLLEVGTGFHPELTGRENVFLNGAVLGMSKEEIGKKFDEIVDFAGVAKFLDTPVKRYSSGMYVRLAFAVAAHLESEILLVDEVLAVGDSQFQKKCLGTMGNFAREGRTVLFISHNMGAINSLCERVIWIDNGKVLLDGPAQTVVNSYLSESAQNASKKVWDEGKRPGNKLFQLVSVSVKNSAGELAKEINISEEATIEIQYVVLEEKTQVHFSVVLFDANGYCVFGALSNTDVEFHSRQLVQGHYVSSCKLYGNLLNNGRYHVSIIGATAYWSEGFRADFVISFDAVDDGVLKGDYPGGYGGVVRPKLSWKTERL